MSSQLSSMITLMSDDLPISPVQTNQLGIVIRNPSNILFTIFEMKIEISPDGNQYDAFIICQDNGSQYFVTGSTIDQCFERSFDLINTFKKCLDCTVPTRYLVNDHCLQCLANNRYIDQCKPEDKQDCIVCNLVKVKPLFTKLKCGHDTTCNDCLTKSKKKCPMCRSPFKIAYKMNESSIPISQRLQISLIT